MMNASSNLIKKYFILSILCTHVMLVEFRQSWFAMVVKYQNGFNHVLEGSYPAAAEVD